MTPSSWNRMSRLALSARILAHLATKDQFRVFFGGMVSSFLTFVMLTLMNRVPRSSPTMAPSREMTFPYSSFASVGTNLGLVFLPVKYR